MRARERNSDGHVFTTLQAKLSSFMICLLWSFKFHIIIVVILAFRYIRYVLFCFFLEMQTLGEQ